MRAPNTVERVHVSRLYGTGGVGKSRETTQRDRARLLVRGWRERTREKEKRKGGKQERIQRRERERERERKIAGGRNGRDRVLWKEKAWASGQGMLVGSLMRLAMHAPYGSDQISDRLPSPLASLYVSPSVLSYGTAKWIAAGSLGLSVYPWCWTLPGYKVHPMFDADGGVRFDALADRLTFIRFRARTVKEQMNGRK